MLADRPHGRRLTAAEQLELDDLERRLLGEDPSARAAARRRAPRTALIIAVIGLGVACLLLVLAGIVGGPGAAIATAVALLATLGALHIGRRRWERRQ